MSERRFTDKPELDPAAVRSLLPNHAAMTGNRTLFPSTVVTVTNDIPDRLLVSGRNNRKLGAMVEKGRYKGYALYGLSLEERATCPADCSVRGACYGNSMQLARRHRIGDADVFFDRLGFEILELLDQHEDGLLIRLHVLGDFPSVEYVAFWADVLNENPKVALYGYTHRRTKDRGGDEIGDAISELKDAQRDRFRVRWSGQSRPDGALVVSHVPNKPRTEDGIVCPAQTDATACCATCALCWEPTARHDAIVFIKHGGKSAEAALESALATPPSVHKATPAPKPVAVAPAAAPPAPAQAPSRVPSRPIAGIAVPSKFTPRPNPGPAPTVRHVRPNELLVEPSYQRDLSGRSITLIRKIVAGFDWAKFKPPVCAETAEGLFIIDGQHTAIAAASHPEIETIPVIVVDADLVELRADAFVAHNRDRLAISVFQVFHAEVAAGNVEARAVMAAIIKGGGSVPRSIAVRGKNQVGEILAMNEARRIFRTMGAAFLQRLVAILVAAQFKGATATVIRATRMLLQEPRFQETARRPDAVIAAALGSIKNIEQASQVHAAATGQGRYRACALLIDEAVKARAGAAP